MRFAPTAIDGVVVIDLDLQNDERGFFARSFCEAEFADAGLVATYSQANVSYNARRGTLRGLHYQASPAEEAKVVRCTAGAAFDVAVDLRIGSPTFRSWVGYELSAANRRALYVPVGCAHGFETLADDTELTYLMSVAYEPSLARGIRWNDPALDITWPIADPIVSQRDETFPSLDR